MDPTQLTVTQDSSGKIVPTTPTPAPPAGGRQPLPGEIAVNLDTLASKPDLPGQGANDLSGTYANVGGTIYNTKTGQAFGKPADFFADASKTTGKSVDSFTGLKFNTGWQPPTGVNAFQQQVKDALSKPNTANPDLNDASAVRAAAANVPPPVPTPTPTTTDNTQQTGASGTSTLLPSNATYDTAASLNGLINLANEMYKRLNDPNNQNALVNAYNSARANVGLPALEQQASTLTGIITGTPEDIKNELTSAGGLVTDSAVSYLAGKRNEILFKQLDAVNTLMGYKKAYVDQVVSLTGQDRQEVDQQFENVFNATTQLNGIQQSIKEQNLTDALKNRDFALSAGITKPFYMVGSTVYSTASGQAFPSKEAYIASGGKGDFSDVQTITTPPGASSFEQIGTDTYGKAVYGFVNPITGQVTPYNQPGTGTTNLGISDGTISGLPSYNTQQVNPGVNRPTRDNNPGDIKVSSWSANLPGVVGVDSTPATDGGHFLVFDNPTSGINAVKTLLQQGSSYQNVTAEAAIRKYSSGGYGAAAVGLNPNQSFQAQIKDPDTLNKVVDKILSNEGYNPQATSNPQTFTALAPDANDPKANQPDPNTGLTPNAIWQFSLQQAFEGGNVQRFVGGLSSSRQATNAKQSISNTAAAIATSLGSNFAQLNILYKANSKAATDIVNRLARIDTISSALTAQFPRLAVLADKVKAAGIGITESDIQAGSAEALRKFGSQDAASYIELVQTVRGDYAAMQAALAGGRGGQFFVQTANDAIPIGLSSQQYNAIQQTIQGSALNAKSATQGEVGSLLNTFSGYAGTPSGYVNSLGTGTDNSAANSYVNGLNLPTP